MKSLPDAVFILDPEGRYLDLNPAAERMSGRTREQMLGQSFWEVRADALRDIPERQFREAFASHAEVDLDAHDTRAGAWYSVRLLPTDNGMYLHARDITRWVSSKRQAGELSRRLRLHMENSPLAVIELDADLRIGRWTGAATRMFGWTAEEMLGRKVNEMRFVVEEDLPSVTRLLEGMFDGNAPKNINTNRNYRKDGKALVCEWYNSNLFDESGNLCSVLCMGLDVTERKVTEQRLRENQRFIEHVLETTPDIVYVYDILEYRAVYTNAAALSVLGYSREQMREMGPSLLPTILHPDDMHLFTGIEQRWQNVKDGQIIETELRARTAEGEWRWFWDRSTVFSRTPDGRVKEVLGSLQDVTERRRAVIELRRARDEAEAANDAKDEFLATISHELRTPLGIVLLWAKLLKNGMVSGEEQRTHAIDLIVQAATDQSRLVNQLLDASRLLHGKMYAEMRPVDLAEVTRSAAEATRPDTEARDVKLSLSLESAVIMGDPAMLRQAVLNVLSNGLKFTPVGGKVSVRLSKTEECASLEISDTGEGIPPELLPHIFEPFRQGESSTTRKHGGMGLGLWITRGLVEMHHGSVQAASPGQGRGATFTITLPLHHSRPAEDDAANNPCVPPARAG